MDTAVPGSSPGALLREARQAKGMDLDTLALSIKVAPRKLEALEGDRYDELPDPGFVRALALTVCRVLGRDPADVLAGLPAVSQGAGLEHVTRGLDQPFDRTGLRLGALVETKMPQFLRPAAVVPALLLAAAAAVWLLWPQRLASTVDTVVSPAASAPEAVPAVEPGSRIEAVADASAVASAATSPASAAPQTAASAQLAAAQPLDLRASSQIAATAPVAPVASVAAVPVPAPSPAPVAAPPVAAAAAADASGPVIATREASWIEARDSRGRTVVSRLVQPGERLVLDGRAPWRIKVGNARGTDLSYNGKPVELQPIARDNVARLELK
ncbi:MAG: helix-turn-helix domain-containing protein [Aquabacterium sp.]|nr:MAG: helix-turn-helix domain-containing protein [Aquabacterium sp.]